ncbi:ABC transporter ATP-binding protein [Azospirillum sp.]|uniref:ABC transporter ATP-binding protein n=1 Tax=Azospirillum sp. TaxID=34012 RepID=UPI003D72AC57
MAALKSDIAPAASPASPPAVELVDVVKRFGGFVATRNVSLTVRRGETVALLGPSGCGKTTLLRMIAGFEAPTSGSVRLAGRDAADLQPYERSVGLLFQQYALFPHMTVEQNVAYGLVRRGWPKAERKARVAEMLGLVRMEHLAGRWPGELSGGQQQRVALARALATQPDVVLLDEPLSALDALLRQTLRRELKEILDAVHATVILVTHDQEEAMSFADRIAVLNGGRVEQEGIPADLYERPANRFVAGFLGRANWIDGVTLIERGGRADIGRSRRGTTLALPPGSLPASDSMDVCVRPERLTRGPGDAATSAPGLLAGTVVEAVHVGADVQLAIETAEGVFSCLERSHGLRLPARGETAVLRIAPEDAILVPAQTA